MSKGVLFFLTESDGRVRQIVNGVVTSLTTKKPLPQAPIGSQDISIGYKRSAEYYGNIRNFSLPLGFVMDGAKILRNDAYKFNFDRELYLLILRFTSELTETHYKNYYKYLYKGQLDFSTLNDRQGEHIVEMSIMEAGTNKLLKSQAGIQFDIPFDEDAINIILDGVKLTGRYTWRMLNADGGANHLVGMVLVGEEQKAPGIVALSVLENFTVVPDSITADDTDYFMTSAITLTTGFGRFTGTMVLKNPDPLEITWLRVNIWNTITGAQKPAVNLYIGPRNETIAIDYSTFEVEEGDRYFMSSPEAFFDFDLTFEIQTKFATTATKAFKPFTLYQKLCGKMGITPDKSTSALLQTCTYCITSGDGLRQIANAGIKTSFNEFFQAFDVYLMAGASVESDILRFETRQTFFNSGDAVQLGEAKAMEISPAKDLLFSSIKVGHKEQTINDVNGKYDFNGFQIWTSPEKIVSRQLDLQSPYKAGPIEIEMVRQNFDGKLTTDAGTDNDTYVIDAKTNVSNIQSVLISFVSSGNYLVFQATPKMVTGQVFSIFGTVSNDRTYTVTSVDDLGATQTVYTDQNITVSEFVMPVQLTWITGQSFLLNRDITVTSGVPSLDTIFNVALSPKRILIKHFPWLRSFLYNYDADSLVFQSANRNADLVAQGITESADIPILSMGEPIARPFYMDFETQVPNDLVDTMEETPNKPFATDWEGTNYKGFLMEGAFSPVMYEQQKYKLLMSAECDPKTLIL